MHLLTIDILYSTYYTVFISICKIMWPLIYNTLTLQLRQMVLSVEEEVLTFSITANLMPEEVVNFDTFAYLTGRHSCKLHDPLKLCKFMFHYKTQKQVQLNS